MPEKREKSLRQKFRDREVIIQKHGGAERQAREYKHVVCPVDRRLPIGEHLRRVDAAIQDALSFLRRKTAYTLCLMETEVKPLTVIYTYCIAV